MEHGVVSSRGAKCAERRAQVESSIFFMPARQAYCAARWRIYLPSNALSHCARSSACRCSVISSSTSPPRSSAGLRLPAFCPAWNGSRATADRASGDQLSQRAFIGDPDRHLIGCPGALMASDTHCSRPSGSVVPRLRAGHRDDFTNPTPQTALAHRRPVRHCRGRAGRATLEYPRVLRAVLEDLPRIVHRAAKIATTPPTGPSLSPCRETSSTPSA